MNRRSLLKSLFTAPAAMAIPSIVAPESKASLPIGSDLSVRALEIALRIGQEKNYGKPRCLIIGPENLFIAREIFGKGVELTYTPDPKTVDQEIFGYRVVSALPMNLWMVQFEKGSVSSQGPN